MSPLAGRRVFGLLLVASLALNAFFVGAIATDWLRLPSREAKGPLYFELRWLEGRLPAADLAAVSAAVDAKRPETEAHIARLKQLRSDLAALAAAAEPDRAAIDAKLGEIRVELDLMLKGVQAAAVDALTKLSPAVRAGLTNGDGR